MPKQGTTQPVLFKYEYNKYGRYNLQESFEMPFESTTKELMNVQHEKTITLQTEYGMFKMKDDETICEMLEKFQTIKNGFWNGVL